MCYRLSIDSLPSFGIGNLLQILRNGALSIRQVEEELKRPGAYVSIPAVCWSKTAGGETTKIAEVDMYLRKDSEGLFLEVGYYSRLLGNRRDRFYLLKRESNLKPGTYRYYFLDPYTEKDSLCSKIYLLPERGFVTRSVLADSRALYSVQRKGHTDRLCFGSVLPDTRYRKTHYRGRTTPFWEGLEKKSRKEWINYVSFCVRRGLITPQEVEYFLSTNSIK